MEYWISKNEEPAGPYTLQQLQQMWGQGLLNSETYYFNELRNEWLLLQTLVENIQDLFSVQEAFVRLGQNRQAGCLLVSSQKETLQLFVNGGFVVEAIGSGEKGEFALAKALHLENTTYDWIFDARAPEEKLRINIADYALKHSIAKDPSNGGAVARKQNTVALPKVGGLKPEPKLNFDYILVPDHAPASVIRLVKNTSIVGRGDDCDIVIQDTMISRKHCLLEVWDQYVKVKDLGSANGTTLNGAPIRDALLNVGGKLGLGPYLLTLQKEQKKAPLPT